MVVKFQVERRPIGPTGKVYYGREAGDGVSLLSMPANTKLSTTGYVNTIKPLSSGTGSAKYIPMGMTIPELVMKAAVSNGSGSSTPAVEEYSHVVEQIGEPWLVYSSHHAVDAAIAAAAPLAAAIGQDNVRIIKVLSHTTEFRLS